MNEDFNRANEHVWRYFELHSQQRMTVFNFYIAITGLLAAGIGFTLQQGGKYALFTSLMGIFVSFISFIFWKLDQRVSMLTKNAELALRDLENLFVNKNLRIITKDNDNNSLNLGVRSAWTYGKCFRISFVIVGITGMILAAMPFLIRMSAS
ncbi:hypothetical protein AB6848_20845 [Serratia proteamaculans]|uniref:hypothetical protein n=1 Tax=Yersiniaceae TaxID=1903411 RepID=UPI0011A3EAA9|nr:hypothetical protein [Yersinia enterocolitica]HDL6777744.1 hypothetical protein [Yersinia enterocolitica]HDL8372250.1 hypothetical protein [Yersinia enterocolitica]HDM8312447.1 hypothetical protein [Yersinia enterocolitica]HDV7144123.1 hypothetical protein [Yersinia enterocolitica]